MRIQRAELHRVLSDLALPYANLRLNSRVVSLDPSTATLILQTGEVITADLIIAADGVRSMIREVVIGGPDKPMPTGDAAYRAVIPTTEMAKDPDLKPFLDTPQMNGWMGPKKHAMMYKIVRIIDQLPELVGVIDNNNTAPYRMERRVDTSRPRLHRVMDRRG